MKKTQFDLYWELKTQEFRDQAKADKAIQDRLKAIDNDEMPFTWNPE